MKNETLPVSLASSNGAVTVTGCPYGEPQPLFEQLLAVSPVTELVAFAPDVFWGDQGNTPILYDGQGNIVDATSCGGGGTLDTPCANTNPEVTMTGSNPSTEFNLQASPNFHLYGVLYQPRGDTLNMQGSGSITTPMVVIAGTLKMGGSPTVLQPLTTNPLLRKMVALVE